MQTSDHSNENYLVLLFRMMYNTVETFESVDEMFKSEHLNKSIDQDFPVVLCASSSFRVCG